MLSSSSGSVTSWVRLLKAGDPAAVQTPAFAARAAEERERLLSLLTKPGLRALALWKMEGYTNQGTAGKLSCLTRTVERKRHVIRSLWNQEITR
jgi:hypothetical protein